MSYEPTEWKTGDVVTAAKLNKMEAGIAEGGGGGGDLFIVRAENDPVSGKAFLDKTWQEIHDAIVNGASFLFYNNAFEDNSFFICSQPTVLVNYYKDYTPSTGPYWARIEKNPGLLPFYSDSPDGIMYSFDE